MNVNNGQLTKKSGSNPRRLTSHQLSLVSIILVITIYLNTTVAFAEESGRYHIVYEADSELCMHLVKLINSDIEQYGRVRYELQPEFVQWKNEEGIDEYRRTPNDPIPWAEVDIDNDGRVEVLYKLRWWLSSVTTEQIRIERDFLENHGERKPLPPIMPLVEGGTQERLKKLERIDFQDEWYPLRKAPGYREYRYRDGPLVRSPNFGARHVYLNVFTWKNTNLLTAEQWVTRDGNWFIVLRFKSAGEYDDICYFRYRKTPDTGTIKN